MGIFTGHASEGLDREVPFWRPRDTVKWSDWGHVGRSRGLAHSGWPSLEHTYFLFKDLFIIIKSGLECICRHVCRDSPRTRSLPRHATLSTLEYDLPRQQEEALYEKG